MNHSKTILSLCDHSGEWARPYAEAGYHICTVDLKGLYSDSKLHRHLPRDIRLLDYNEDANIHGILAAPPCTDFSGSGAQYWPQKDTDGRTIESLAIVDACLRAVAIYKPAWWVLENPVGRLKNFIGPCADQFDPCDFAGYELWDATTETHGKILDVRRRSEAGEKLTKADVELVLRYNLYTKRTQLWGSFTPPLRNRVEPIRVSGQGSPIQLLGGKSEKTKELRSITPKPQNPVTSSQGT